MKNYIEETLFIIFIIAQVFFITASWDSNYYSPVLFAYPVVTVIAAITIFCVKRKK
ncbi:hypothetical protein [Periweissella cryptocerci]|uniref:hypothetical protein n=1 Tax=Periweissella cryptocerci TaxID=2506420 RepID=UPI0014047C4C|nr:hypothetical protein [Periweissella cryptocerci]